ncbi:hypothetical protein D3C83_283280 [compost metagenome]
MPGLIGTKKISASPASSNSSSVRVIALISTPPASTLRRKIEVANSGAWNAYSFCPLAMIFN